MLLIVKDQFFFDFENLALVTWVIFFSFITLLISFCDFILTFSVFFAFIIINMLVFFFYFIHRFFSSIPISFIFAFYSILICLFTLSLSSICLISLSDPFMSRLFDPTLVISWHCPHSSPSSSWSNQRFIFYFIDPTFAVSCHQLLHTQLINSYFRNTPSRRWNIQSKWYNLNSSDLSPRIFLSLCLCLEQHR